MQYSLQGKHNDCKYKRFSLQRFHNIISLASFLSCIFYTFLCPLWKVLNLSVGRSVCRPNDVSSISFDPFAWMLPNIVQWIYLENTWTLLILRSHGQRSKSNCWFLYKWCPLNICLLFRWKVDKFSTKVRWPQLIFRIHCQKSRSNFQSLNKCCPLNISWQLCWKVTKHGTVNTSREYLTALDVQVKYSKVKVELLAFETNVW